MLSNLYLLWIFVIVWQPTFCFYNLCQTPKNQVLNNEECSDLYFEENEKATSLGQVRLELEQNSLRITPEATSWTNTFLKITGNNDTNFCSKLSKDEHPSLYCFTFAPEAENETFLVEYRIENLPEISSRRFVFLLPSFKEVPLFLYVDETNKARLVLRGQKLPTLKNISAYKVEAYKEKNENTNLLDLRLFSSEDEIYYELFTYKDMGYYYFVVWIISDDCTGDGCLKISSPKVFIGRKSTRVVIGIVGASFILPFILFLFHILTKKYQPEENRLINEERLVVAYKSSSKKHNELVIALANFLEKTCQDHVIDLIDLSKPSKKFSEKFCADSLLLANRIVYVAPPKRDSNPIFIDKSLSEKEFVGVVFDHCTDKLPQFFAPSKTFKLFADFEKFLQVLNLSGAYDADLYRDLLKKSEEATAETDLSPNADALPQIVVTESEPQENDLLISSKVAL